MEITIIPSLQKKLKEKKYHPHGKIILKLVNKIRRLGLNALKILDVEDVYLLCEVKVKKPPYRLYVIVDQKSNHFYLVEWEHKNKQEKIIENLKKKLKIAIEYGLESLI